MALHAILTAGGMLPTTLKQYCPSGVKALLPFGEQNLLTIAAQAAQATPGLERIAVVGGADVEATLPSGTEYVAQSDNVVDNIRVGFEFLGGEPHDYLVISPDLPFLTGSMLEEFQGLARNSCAIGVPWVSQEDFLNQYPSAPNKFELIDRRRMTMGSVMYMTGPIIKLNIPLWRDLYANRRFPHRLAIMLGWPILFSFLFRRLRLALVEERLSRLCDGPVRGIQVTNAGLAYDIDNLDNYKYALQQLAR